MRRPSGREPQTNGTTTTSPTLMTPASHDTAPTARAPRDDVTVDVPQRSAAPNPPSKAITSSTAQTERDLKRLLWLCAECLSGGLTVSEEDDVRDRHDAEPLGDLRLLVVVDLHELEVMLLRQTLYNRRDRAA